MEVQQTNFLVEKYFRQV